jgi:mannose-6-phosphate isomerase-like protein (cupin superfamily)
MSEVFEAGALAGKTTDQQRYHEFLRVPAMSAGMYVLGAGATDRQSPHTEDEIYYVVRGKGKVRIGRE